jgi:beta-ribofuranosylaminobenzene 5'-phosphate synthase
MTFLSSQLASNLLEHLYCRVLIFVHRGVQYKMHVEVSAPARLHLGDLDPFALGRFGYAPVLAIEAPRTVVEAADADELEVNGLEVNDARIYAQRVLEAFNLKGAKVTVKTAAPRNAGFGSTTQLCLAVGRAVTKAHDLDVPLIKLVRALRRTSTGGIYPFQMGGLVVAGGFSVKPGERVLMRDEPLIPPLIFRADFPEDWRFVIVRPLEAPKSPDKEVEEDAFRALREGKVPAELIHKGYFVLAAKLLPALLERDAVAFGKALTEIQMTVGRIYQPVQESIFNPASQWLIPILNRSGALGIGQSSWGPSVYAFTDNPDDAQRIAEQLKVETRESAEVKLVGADNSGATVKTF